MASEAVPPVGLAEVLKAADVSEVIWIDDLFDHAGGNSIEDTTANLARLHGAGLRPDHSVFRPLDGADDVSEWSDALRTVWADAQVRADVLKAVNEALVRLPETHARDDYDGGTLEAILESFGGRVVKLGYEDWRTDKSKYLDRVDSRTLVIIDREFSSAQASNEGDAILAEFVARKSGAFLTVLTHSVGEDDAERTALRDDISRMGNIPIEDFTVLSKRSSVSGAEVALRSGIRVLLTQRTCALVARSVTDTFKAALDEAGAVLVRESIFDVDNVVFERSMQEGASEVDVIVRLLSLRGRVKVEESLVGLGQVHRELERLRALRAIEPVTRDRVGDGTFEKWRRDEVYDPAERVNGRHAPLALGDLFLPEGGKTPWMLLAQPCDLAVRKDGKRKASEGIFVRLKEPAKDASRAELSGRFFKIPALEQAGYWNVDMLCSATVLLRVLDFCVFRTDGSVAFDITQEAPADLLPGWRIRMNEIRKTLESDKRKSLMRLSLTEDFSNAQAEEKGQVLKYRFKRIGRLRAPWAVAAYVALASYQTRAAFEHDFSEGLRANPAVNT